ncbi:hypothetical protein GQR58_019831 [Nymphon striatum]|nr:hypothetical protein GQR58_019831 [Nymphon striatum]
MRLIPRIVSFIIHCKSAKLLRRPRFQSSTEKNIRYTRHRQKLRRNSWEMTKLTTQEQKWCYFDFKSLTMKNHRAATFGVEMKARKACATICHQNLTPLAHNTFLGAKLRVEHSVQCCN